MENGGGGGYEGSLADKFSGLAVISSDVNNNKDGLFQVMKAVEAAEVTIKQQ
ncbi:unnamed protein product, partial [Ilex paraguariensis]